ncbi:MAG: CoA transferase [Dehalococcoidia bacterium]|nr:CoA transferase [Dehalococcoidia bacterium]
MGRLPLEGIRVAATTIVWAGSFAEMLLADWGAEVIKVESLDRFPTSTRGYLPRPTQLYVQNAPPTAAYPQNEAGARPWNRCSLFNYHARNKLSCTMDLTRPEGKELFKRLIAKCDVFIENNAYGVVDRLGIGYEVLKEITPGLIMVSLPGFGATGPYKDFRGFGMHQEAFAGHTWLRGYPDLDPSATAPVVHNDACAGANAAYAVMIALVQRRRTGAGQFIDLAQTEAAISHHADAVLDYTMNGRARESTGNRHASAAPCGAYRCRGEDEWVAITIYDDLDWTGFCRTLGNPAWTKEDRFSSSLTRWNNQDALDRLVENWTSRQSSYEVMYALQEQGVAAGPVISNKDAFDDPQLIERGQFEELHQEECGNYLTPGLLWRAEYTPNRIRLPAVRLGEHNEYVYKEVMGISDDEYARLEKAGHIGMDLAPHLR